MAFKDTASDFDDDDEELANMMITQNEISVGRRRKVKQQKLTIED